MKGVEKGFRIALMCSEKDPFDCHRSILVAKEFYERGYEIKHSLTMKEEREKFWQVHNRKLSNGGHED
ncbi:Protein of unknown function, DUF488 [Carboxydocella thermautotrophica]|nr:Protein of unknown function, DUF488 [Carboxydocella thermautotrophica]